MADLLASLEGKSLTINRGDVVKGKVIASNNTDLVIDLGTKAEGILPKKDLYGEYENLKIGDNIEAFVAMAESESGQVLLSLDRPTNQRAGFRNTPVRNWGKFISAMNQKKKLHGKVSEINKGGLVVEIEGIRAFLPTSQISFGNVGAINDIVGSDLAVTVIEVDANNNRLIVSDREEPSVELLDKLSTYEVGQKVSGEVVAVFSFGVIINVDGLEGILFGSDVAWERVENLAEMFKVGASVEALVAGVDQKLGRLLLSVKKMTDDPFTKMMDKYQPDDVVKAKVVEVGDVEISFELTGGVKAVMDKAVAGAKAETTYEVGSEVTVLIDGVDPRQRKITVAPMLTSTSGLIYK